MKPYLSIILPVANESENLPLVVSEIDKYLEGLNKSSEIVVVSYAENNQIPEITKKLSLVVRNLKLVTSLKNQGLGEAVRQGMLLSNGEIKLLTDINNFISIDQAESILPLFEKGADVVIGRREESAGQNFSLPFFAKMLFSRSINLVFQKTLFKDLQDTTSGFRAFKSDSAEKIFTDLKSTKINFLVSTLQIAKKHNLNIQESPVFINRSSLFA